MSEAPTRAQALELMLVINAGATEAAAESARLLEEYPDLPPIVAETVRLQTDVINMLVSLNAKMFEDQLQTQDAIESLTAKILDL